MRKQDYIHLHGLLHEIAKNLTDGDDLPDEITEYEQMNVSPTSIHKSKTEHKEALQALSSGITDYYQNESRDDTEAKSPHPD